MLDFRLPAEEFFRLTPRQFDLLDRRYREHLAHAEMVGAFTTAAVVNHSVCPPKEPVAPVKYMPNAQGFEAPRPMTDDELAAESDYNLKALRLSIQMKQERARKEAHG